MAPTDIALLGLRLWLAAVMAAHGINHARSIDGTASWFASTGFRRARLQARLSAAGELAIAAALAVGLVTSVAAAGLVATMAVAFWTIHRFAGFFVFHRPDEGWEYVATLAVAASALAVLGPGELSLDAALGLAGALDGWVGLATALGGGLLAAALQLAAFWRRPADAPDDADAA
jgi:putative oxidoreductase